MVSSNKETKYRRQGKAQRKKGKKMSEAAATKRAPAFETKKVMIEFSGPFIEKIDALAENLHITRSQLIREALDEKLERIRRRQLEQELREAYQAKAELYRKDYNEFLEPMTIETFARVSR